MHNIEYYTYPENIHRDYVQRELDHHAAMEDYQEGCTGLGQKIRWLDSLQIQPDYESAEAAIKVRDRGNYDQLAVRFYSPKRATAGKKYAELQQKASAARDAYSEKANAVWAGSVKAEFVSCKACGSKLRREYIHGNNCPVCRNDLRPETMKKAVAAAKKRLESALANAKAYELAHSEKEVLWLVKIEYHT